MREFHKVLHEITEASPLLGWTLRALLLPVSYAHLVATLAHAYFKRQIEAIDLELDELANRN